MARPQPAAAIADLGVGQSEPHEEGHGDGHDIGRSEGLEPDGYLLSVLSEAVAAVEGAGIPYVLMGGIGSAAFGRARSNPDIDFFVRPESARPVLEALAAAGFDTEERDPRWLFKGYKHDMLVDVIFRSSGDIYLDEEMLARSTVESFGSCRARVIPPEDLVVIKAVTADEHVPHHWYDALGLIGGGELDWDYLVSRARRHGTRRVLSLLLYAMSDDLGVPWRPVKALFDAVGVE